VKRYGKYRRKYHISTTSTSTTTDRGTYPTAAVAAAPAIPLKFHPQNEKPKNLRPSEIHYEMILKIWKTIVK
jgi:hypothetical protein